jgi:formylglycine-generating enzyme required for sulfatase activity
MHAEDADNGFMRYPVAHVSWNDASVLASFVGSQLGEQAAAYEWRLPSEVEWELSCRAGTRSEFTYGDALTSEQANVATGAVQAVAQFAPNALGLFDMHGNVEEWMLNSYQSQLVMAKRVGPPQSDETPLKSVRGGSARDPAQFARSSNRFARPSMKADRFLGFRLVVTKK